MSERFTIGAQFNAANHSLVFFVADRDGEWVFHARGCLTLGAIAETGGIVAGSTFASNAAYQACVNYCGGRPYDVSQCLSEAVEAKRAADLESMLRS